MNAPLDIKGIDHTYHFTVDGYPVCFNHLVLHHDLTATLIHQYDDNMDEMSFLINQEDVKVDSDWLPYEVKSNNDQSSLVYYSSGLTVKEFTDEVKHLKTVKKLSMIRIPHHLPKKAFQYSNKFNSGSLCYFCFLCVVRICPG